MKVLSWVKLGLGFAILVMAWTTVYGQQLEKSQGSRLNIDVNVVLVDATVTDPEGRYVTTLSGKHFRIWEDKAEQKLEYFAAEDVPVSVGIIFDVSASMKNKIPIARDAAVKFLEMGNRDDEYFLLEFSSRPEISTDFTPNSSKVQKRIPVTATNGNTALFDAIYMGVQKVKTGHNPRKALLLITDGQDNWSSYTYSQVKELIRESDVQLYAVGLVNDWNSHYHMQPEEIGVSRSLLKRLSDESGGRAFFANSVFDLDDICAEIALDLKSQYLLGYVSTNTNKDGKWRKISLKVERAPGLPRLHLRAKSGYYAPTGSGSVNHE